MRPVRRRQLVVCAVMGSCALLLPATGCSLGDKEAFADRIIGSVDALAARGTARGTLSASVDITGQPPGVEDSPLGALGEMLPGGGDAMAAAPVRVALDLDERRAVFAAEHPYQVYEEQSLYGRRLDAAAREARPWLKLDLADLGDSAELLDIATDPPTFVVNALSPVLLVDLIAGALTGSIERVGPEEVGRFETTRFDANFDIDKTLRDTREDAYDDDARESIENAFDVLGIDGAIHEGSVWLDADDIPRRFEVALVIEPLRDVEIEVRVRLELTELGRPVKTTAPGPAEIVEIDSLLGFLRSVVPKPAVALP